MIDIIKKQLTLIYDGDAWYGPSIKTTLKSVKPRCVYNSPRASLHPIAELVAHMISWRTFAVRRLNGDDSFLPEQENTFDWRPFSTDKKKAWGVMKKQLGINQHQLLRLLDQHDDFTLEHEVPGKSYTFHYLLMGLIQHDVYHLGQIVYIQRLLEEKNCDRPTGRIPKYSHTIFSFENLALQK
ncbi:MAG: DinB family protein [Balneolaceae bacterium]|nr:DinB family protein [Balneolaceae bacterium]